MIHCLNRFQDNFPWSKSASTCFLSCKFKSALKSYVFINLFSYTFVRYRYFQQLGDNAIHHLSRAIIDFAIYKFGCQIYLWTECEHRVCIIPTAKKDCGKSARASVNTHSRLCFGRKCGQSHQCMQDKIYNRDHFSTVR